MASRPGLQALEARIAVSEDGEDWVFEQIAEGRTVGTVAKELGVSRGMLYTWRNCAPHRARRTLKWKEALKLSAEAHADRGLEELEVPPSGSILHAPAVQARTNRSKYRQWLASHRDPQLFGSGGAQFTGSLGEFHLAAVQRIKNEGRQGIDLVGGAAALDERGKTTPGTCADHAPGGAS